MQKDVQHDFDRKAAKMSALSSKKALTFKKHI